MRQGEAAAQCAAWSWVGTVASARIAGLALLALASAGPVRAQTLAALPDSPLTQRLETTGGARPVQAWTQFCARYPGECEVNPAEPATVAMTGRIWKTLNATNRLVNTKIKPRTDLEHWGVVDRWDLAEDGYGDCEDYQLLKRKILVEQHGLPRRALRLTVVVDEQGEGHAVLMVRTDSGDFILDNKRSSILSWQDTGYVFVKREGQDSRDWVSLGDRSSPATTANR
jgi:predicted transglutaminase-like cysteine proteinase